MVLLTKGPGIHIKGKGKRVRKTVRGNTISASIVQVNLKVIKEGSKKLDELFEKKAENAEEARKEVKKKEESIKEQVQDVEKPKAVEEAKKEPKKEVKEIKKNKDKNV